MVRLLLLCAILASLSLPVWAQNEKAKPQEVTKLDGRKILGIVEITDDYTIRISSETGLQKIPIALLSQADFEKFTRTKDRSQDGRLWSERKAALVENRSQNKEKSGEIEIRLGEIAAFQPLIDAYEKSLTDKKKSPESTKPGSENTDLLAPVQSLFSGPGTTLGGVPGAGAAGSVIAPAVSTGAGALQSLAPAAP
jgi:hypothetical protein